MVRACQCYCTLERKSKVPSQGQFYQITFDSPQFTVSRKWTVNCGQLLADSWDGKADNWLLTVLPLCVLTISFKCLNG